MSCVHPPPQPTLLVWSLQKCILLTALIEQVKCCVFSHVCVIQYIIVGCVVVDSDDVKCKKRNSPACGVCYWSRTSLCQDQVHILGFLVCCRGQFACRYQLVLIFKCVDECRLCMWVLRCSVCTYTCTQTRSLGSIIKWICMSCGRTQMKDE